MDGATLLYSLRNLLNEDSTSSFMDTRTSYSYLWEAAREFVARTNCLQSTCSITTVASTQAYNLNGDFMKLYLKDRDRNFFIKYTPSGSTTSSFIPWRSYGEIIYSNNTTAVAIPNCFTVIDGSTLQSRITSTATSTGAASGGECTLTDSTAPFSSVWPGDEVHNTTDGSDGIVIAKTSSSTLVVALFGGTNNDWTSADSYIIQPKPRFQLYLDPPPSNSGDTITIYHIQIPDPVFSSYRLYRIPDQYADCLVKYAAWLYKNRDKEPDFGDIYLKIFERQVRSFMPLIKSTMGSYDFPVSFKKR